MKLKERLESVVWFGGAAAVTVVAWTVASSFSHPQATVPKMQYEMPAGAVATSASPSASPTPSISPSASPNPSTIRVQGTMPAKIAAPQNEPMVMDVPVIADPTTPPASDSPTPEPTQSDDGIQGPGQVVTPPPASPTPSTPSHEPTPVLP